MNFVAIDVETANADMASICSIGAVRFENGKVADEWYSLVDPRDYFDGINVSIHGIDEGMVRGAPTYGEAAGTLHAMLQDAVTVTHTHFDRVATHQASSRWKVGAPTCTWLDSARVARRAWEECASSGYGLANVCRLIGYEFQHHNALEDAKAAGHVMLAAMERTGLDLDGWLARVAQPIDPSSGSSGAAVRRDGNIDGPLHGEVVVLTGGFDLPKSEQADLAAFAGCEVAPGVTKKTTLVVVGDNRFARGERSGKWRKAEELIRQGSSLRIMCESDFRAMIAD